MFGSIFRFEVRYHLRQPLVYLVTAFLWLFVVLILTSDASEAFGATGQVHINSPQVIVGMLSGFSLLGLFFVTAFVASSAHRDFAHGTHELFFSKPMKKGDYLFGRFAGSMLVTSTVFIGCALGILMASWAPWLDPERLGPFQLAPYLFALGVLVLPNLFFMGATFFALTLVTRSLFATYLGTVVFYAGYIIAQTLTADLDNDTLAALLDPFGSTALGNATQYWTVAERNSAVPELAGDLLLNRLLWLGVSLLILGLAYLSFSYSRSVHKATRGRRTRDRAEQLAESPAPARTSPPRVRPRFTGLTALRQFLHQTRFETVQVLRSIPFAVILALGLFLMVFTASQSDRSFGTAVHPMTYLMLDVVEILLAFLVILITFYSGDMVWKERSLKLAEVYDATPVPGGVFLGAKLAALGLIIAVCNGAGVVATILYQLSLGHTRLELPLYAKGFVLELLPVLLFCCLAVFLQVLARNKFIGFALMIAFLLLPDILFTPLHLEHFLYRFPEGPALPYSDMNGYGHFLPGYLWLKLYWGFFALMLLTLALLFWKRGTELDWKLRLAAARQRFTAPARALLATGAIGFLASGAFIFYNTNVLNEYVPGDLAEERQAEYELQYRRHEEVPLPQIQAVRADVDIWPGERKVEIRGTYKIANETSLPIRELHIGLPPAVTVRELDLPPHRQTLADRTLGYSIYELERPLEPGDTLELGFDLVVESRGFRNHGSDVSRVGNGTFFNNGEYFPRLGYDRARQLVDRNARRRHGLEPAPRMARIDDLAARHHTFTGRDADWIEFETTVSTSADQIAIAPGYLERQWTEDDRRYFHYKMDAPILNFFSYLSARYEVLRDRWHDVDIEIYYHPGHEYNLDRMVEGVKKSLDYFTASFGPYQHRQVRIIEFPRYRSFAQAFPNTIPFSESIGFIARLDGEDAIDYPFYVTAHEVAHQWWGHQVAGAFVQGATMLAETMSQYSALMVMEKEYGPEKMRRFLKYELDNYLQSRGREVLEEMPLQLVENQQYIHYRKGSVVMYALRDHLGEAALNGAIRRYVEDVAFQEPPFTVSLELLERVREAVPEKAGYAHLIDDLFATITLFDNELESATASERADGTWVVHLEARTRKLRADGQGEEKEIPVDDWIDIVVFGEDGDEVLFFEKRHIRSATPSFEIVVDAAPGRAGIDPYNKLIDRDSGDNVKRVDREAS